MSARTETTAPGSRNDSDKPLLVILILGIALMLIVGNVQLWRLADRGEASGETARGAATESPSSLPPPVSGTSNDVLSSRLRRLSENVTTPLDGLSSQLKGLEAFGPAQAEMVRQLTGVNASIQRFGGVRGELGQLTAGISSLGTDMGAMRTNTKDLLAVMKRVQRQIADTSDSTREASEETAALGASMTSMVQGIEATNVSTREASAGIAAMGEDTAAMSAAIAETAASGKEMNAALVEMNETMSRMLEFFCLAFASTTRPCKGIEEAPPVTETSSSPDGDPSGVAQMLSPAGREAAGGP